MLPSSELIPLLASNEGLGPVRAYLESLRNGQLQSAVLGLRGPQLGRLFELASEGLAPSLEELVPPGGRCWCWEGRNSLPLFSRFQKCFTRLGGGAVLGWNRQPLHRLTGPGYFQVRPAGGEPPWPRELLFDYRGFPRERPSGWPRPRSNRSLPSRLVFGGLVDYVRRVTDGVLVGRATREGKILRSWFVLVRPTAPCS